MGRASVLRAIIFDLDGLMADSEPLALWAWQQTLVRFGHQLDEQTFREVLGMRVTALLDRVQHCVGFFVKKRDIDYNTYFFLN